MDSAFILRDRDCCIGEYYYCQRHCMYQICFISKLTCLYFLSLSKCPIMPGTLHYKDHVLIQAAVYMHNHYILDMVQLCFNLTLMCTILVRFPLIFSCNSLIACMSFYM